MKIALLLAVLGLVVGGFAARIGEIIPDAGIVLPRSSGTDSAGPPLSYSIETVRALHVVGLFLLMMALARFIWWIRIRN